MVFELDMRIWRVFGQEESRVNGVGADDSNLRGSLCKRNQVRDAEEYDVG